MKRFITLLLLAFTFNFAVGQIGVFREVITRDSQRINGTWVSGVVTDTSFTAASASKIPTAKAVKAYVAKELAAFTSGANVSFSIVDGGDSLAITDGVSTLKVAILDIAPIQVEVDGSVTNELQTITNSSDATSHTIVLSSSGGSITFQEGDNITLATSGDAANGTLTITGVPGVDSVHTYGDSIFLFVGADSFLVSIDQSITTRSRTITGNNTIDIDATNFISWRDNDNTVRVIWGNFGEVWETRSKSGLSSVGANNQTVYFNGTTIGGLIINEVDGSFKFVENRSPGSQVGMEYGGDYSADIKANPRSVPDVGTVAEIIGDSLAGFSSGEGVYVQLAPISDTAQIIRGDLSFSPIELSSTHLTDATLLSSGTDGDRRLRINTTLGLLSTFVNGDVCWIGGATGANAPPDGYYAVNNIWNKTSYPYTLSTTQKWLDVPGINVGTTVDSVRCFKNNFPTYDSIDIVPTSCTIDDSFQPQGRMVILSNLTGFTQTEYFQEIDSVWVTASNDSDLPVGAYRVFGTGVTTLIIDRVISSRSSGSFTGDVWFRRYNTDNFLLNFKSGDTLHVTGDLIVEGDSEFKNLTTVTATNSLVIDANGKMGVGDLPLTAVDSSIFVTQYQLDTAKVNLRAEIASAGGGGGGGGGGDSIFVARSSTFQMFEEFLSASTTTNTIGTHGWTNAPTGSSTTVMSPINETTAVGTVNLRGHNTNTFENRLTILQNLQISDTDFELEIRLRSVHASFGSAGETFYFGFGRSTYTAGGVPSDGIGFVMNSTGTVGRNDAAGATTVNFTNDVSTTYVVVKIVYTQSTGTVEYFVNGVSQGTANTNVPTNTDFRLDATYATAVGSIGTTAANGGPIIDYIYFKKAVTR